MKSKKAAKFGIFFLTFGTTLLLPLDSANATSTANVQVICANPDGEQRTFTVGWDNANAYFDGKGQISRLYCEGGYAGAYTVFVSNNLGNTALDYYNGILPVPTAPSVNESVTATVDSQTVIVQPAPQETQTVTVQNPPETSTNQSQPTNQDSETVNPSDSLTPTIQESVPATVDSPTSIVDSQTSNSSESQTAQIVPPVSDSSTETNIEPPSLPVPDSSTPVQETATVTAPIAPQAPLPSPIEPSPTPAPTVSEPIAVVPAPVPVQPEPAPAPVISPPAPEPVEPPAPAPAQPEPVEPEPAPPVEPEIAPAPVEPEPDPVAIADPIPAPDPVALPVPAPTIDPTPVAPNPVPANPISEPLFAPVSVLTVDVATLPPETPVELENGVILEAGVVVALELLDNPGELLASILTNPAQALKSIANIGADMTPEDRKKAQTTTVAAVLTGVAIRRMN